MRVLHTGDWHMNDHLGRIDRSEDIERALERIAGYLDTENVDVMVVAGDLFSEYTNRDTLRHAVSRLETIFGPFLSRGGTIVAVSGNHDREVYFETLRSAMGLAPGIPGLQGSAPTGRLHLFTRPNLLKLADRNGNIVQFALMPYPGAYWLKEPNFEAFGDDGVGQNRRIQDRFTRYLREYLLGKVVDPALPTVLVSHILIEGTATRAGYKLDSRHDVGFLPADIPTNFAYVAYGHIHQPQEAVSNAPWVRYCGSIDRLDYGEAKDDKSVALVDIGPYGRIGEVRLLPLESSPISRFELTDPEADLAQLEAHWSGHPDRARMLVYYILNYRPGIGSNLDSLRRRLHTLFPRWYGCDLRPLRVGGGEGEGIIPAIDLADVEKTTLLYMEKALKSDPRREVLLVALNDLLHAPDDGADDAEFAARIKPHATTEAASMEVSA